MTEQDEKQPLFLSFHQSQQQLGIGNQTLTGRGCTVHVVDGTKSFLMSDILAKAPDLLAAKFSPDFEELKIEKTAQEVRKLRIENDEKEGALVPASDVDSAFQRRSREVVEILETLPAELLAADPDMPESVLSVINEGLAEIKSKALSGKPIL